MTSTDLHSSEKEVLSPVEVERLLAKVSEQDGSAAVSPLDIPSETGQKLDLQPYDFRCPTFLTAQELRSFRREHEAIVESIASRLSNYLRIEFGLRLSEVDTVPYQKLVDGLPNPCHVTLFKAEPMRGICILDLTPKMGLAISDRLMGGKGNAPTLGRELSQMELAVLDQAVQIILAEWCTHWSKVQPLTPAVLGYENAARFLRIAKPDAMMIAIRMEARLGECIEPIQLVFPHSALEPIIEELRLKANAASDHRTAAQAAPKPKWKRDFDTLKVRVVARSLEMSLKARDVARLQAGEVVPLSQDFPNRVRLCFGAACKFYGRLGSSENQWAVEITEVIRS